MITPTGTLLRILVTLQSLLAKRTEHGSFGDSELIIGSNKWWVGQVSSRTNVVAPFIYHLAHFSMDAKFLSSIKEILESKINPSLLLKSFWQHNINNSSVNNSEY